MTKYSLINPNFITTSSFGIKACQMFDRIIFTELEKWLNNIKILCNHFIVDSHKNRAYLINIKLPEILLHFVAR